MSTLYALNQAHTQGVKQAWIRDLLTSGAVCRGTHAQSTLDPRIQLSKLTIDIKLVPDPVLKKMAGALVGQIRSTPTPHSPLLMTEVFTGCGDEYEMARRVREAHPQGPGLKVPQLLRLRREGSRVTVCDGVMSQTVPKESRVTVVATSLTENTMETISAVERLGYRLASLAFLVGPLEPEKLERMLRCRCDSIFSEDQFTLTAV